MATDDDTDSGAEATFETHKFELATYITGVKKIQAKRHWYDWDTGQWRFIYAISQEEAEAYEAEYLVSESKDFSDTAGYFKKSKGRNPRRRGGR